MTTQPDTAAAIKEIQARHDASAGGHGWVNSSMCQDDRAYLLAQLTEANERADEAIAEAVVTEMVLEEVQECLQNGFAPAETRSHLYLAVAELLATKTSKAQTFLADHRRLVERQKTPGTVDVCEACGTDSRSPLFGHGCIQVCPIRAGVKP